MSVGYPVEADQNPGTGSESDPSLSQADASDNGRGTGGSPMGDSSEPETEANSAVPEYDRLEVEMREGENSAGSRYDGSEVEMREHDHSAASSSRGADYPETETREASGDSSGAERSRRMAATGSTSSSRASSPPLAGAQALVWHPLQLPTLLNVPACFASVPSASCPPPTSASFPMCLSLSSTSSYRASSRPLAGARPQCGPSTLT